MEEYDIIVETTAEYKQSDYVFDEKVFDEPFGEVPGMNLEDLRNAYRG